MTTAAPYGWYVSVQKVNALRVCYKEGIVIKAHVKTVIIVDTGSKTTYMHTVEVSRRHYPMLLLLDDLLLLWVGLGPLLVLIVGLVVARGLTRVLVMMPALVMHFLRQTRTNIMRKLRTHQNI